MDIAGMRSDAGHRAGFSEDFDIFRSRRLAGFQSPFSIMAEGIAKISGIGLITAEIQQIHEGGGGSPVMAGETAAINKVDAAAVEGCGIEQGIDDCEPRVRGTDPFDFFPHGAQQIFGIEIDAFNIQGAENFGQRRRIVYQQSVGLRRDGIKADISENYRTFVLKGHL